MLARADESVAAEWRETEVLMQSIQRGVQRATRQMAAAEISMAEQAQLDAALAEAFPARRRQPGAGVTRKTSSLAWIGALLALLRSPAWAVAVMLLLAGGVFWYSEHGQQGQQRDTGTSDTLVKEFKPGFSGVKASPLNLILYPAGEISFRRPAILWNSDPERTDYEVAIVKAEDGEVLFHSVGLQSPVEFAALKPAGSLRELEPGEYAAQVRWKLGAKATVTEVHRSKFRVLRAALGATPAGLAGDEAVKRVRALLDSRLYADALAVLSLAAPEFRGTPAWKELRGEAVQNLYGLSPAGSEK